MTCNYFDYMKLVDELFFGVALTDEQLNNAVEKIRQYIVNGGAGKIVESLGVGFRIVEKQFQAFPELNRVITKRFIFVDGERKGEELTINEIRSIGMFLKHGAFYGKKLIQCED